MLSSISRRMDWRRIWMSSLIIWTMISIRSLISKNMIRCPINRRRRRASSMMVRWRPSSLRSPALGIKFRRIIILKKKKEIRLRSLRNLMTLKKQANNQVLKVNKPSYQRLSKRNQTIPVRAASARNMKHLENLNRNLKGHPKKANPAYHRTWIRIK